MVFNSPIFLFAFFPLCFGLSRLLRSRGARSAGLAAASLVFYAFCGVSALPVLLLSALFNYGLGLLLAQGASARHVHPGRHQRLLCGAGIAADLALLCFYKYVPFLCSLFGMTAGSASVPAGISFFTFQAVAYLIDVSRDPSQALRRFDELLLYLAFFPRLLSGPLQRTADFSAQLDAPLPALSELSPALRRFIRGFARKVLLADLVGALADTVFSLAPAELSSPLAWLGAIAYTLQLYFDFSGYTDMAIGAGACLGFTLPENFNYPYVSLTLTEFWRRWHITLSRWFRDYVYIPLGGSRCGARRTAVNKLIVFLLTGIWHGAGWTFLLWGLWHGGWMMAESAAKPFLERVSQRRSGRVILRIYTLLLVVSGFVLFRSASLSGALQMLGRMFAFDFAPLSAGTVLALRGVTDSVHILSLCLAAVFSAPVLSLAEKRLPAGAAGELIRDGAALLLFVLSLLGMAGSSFTPFIYFQF